MGVTKGQRFVVYDDRGRIVFERWENFAGERVAAAITGADAEAE
jgi:hypothetical protein